MYALGIDLGTTYTAAAVWREGRAEIVSLGGRTAAIPSVVLLREDETFLTGEAANRRGLSEPSRVAREFKRRIGDTTPILLAGTPHSAESLSSRLLRAVMDEVVKREGGPPAAVCVSHPANWGPYKIDLLGQAVRMADLPAVVFATEPEAAAVHYAQEQRLGVGAIVAVYDLGGGTFDAAVLRRTAGGFTILGKPEGIERLGGIDFDAAVFNHVRTALGGKLDELDEDDPAAISAVARLREECVQAKEALSADTDTTIPVLLPTVTTDVRLTRGEFESMVRPALHGSIEALRRAVRSAGCTPEQLHSVLLVGGSSRMPIVGQLVSAELGRPVAVDTHPKHAVALGAAWRAGATLTGQGRSGGSGGQGGSGGWAGQQAGRRGAGPGPAAGAAAAGAAAGLGAGYLAGQQPARAGFATGPADGGPGSAGNASGFAGGPAGAPGTAGNAAGSAAAGFAGGPAGASGNTGNPAGSAAAGFAGGPAGASGTAGNPAGTAASAFAGGPADGPGTSGSAAGPATAGFAHGPADSFGPGTVGAGSAPAGFAHGPADGPGSHGGTTASPAGPAPGTAGKAARSGRGLEPPRGSGSSTRMMPAERPAAEPVGPPPVERTDRRKRVLALGTAVAVMVLLAGGGVALAVFNGDDNPGAASPPPSTTSKAASPLPADEQCTEEIMSSPRWVCLTSAAVTDGKLTIRYETDGAPMSIDGGHHLHVYGGDGTNPAEHVMGRHAHKSEQGKWYVEDRRPAVLDLTDQRYLTAIGDAPKVCARVAAPDHKLVKAADGSYRTGNCVPITGNREVPVKEIPRTPRNDDEPHRPTTTTETTTTTTEPSTTEPTPDSEPETPPSEEAAEESPAP